MLKNHPVPATVRSWSQTIKESLTDAGVDTAHAVLVDAGIESAAEEAVHSIMDGMSAEQALKLETVFDIGIAIWLAIPGIGRVAAINLAEKVIAKKFPAGPIRSAFIHAIDRLPAEADRMLKDSSLDEDDFRTALWATFVDKGESLIEWLKNPLGGGGEHEDEHPDEERPAQPSGGGGMSADDRKAARVAAHITLFHTYSLGQLAVVEAIEDGALAEYGKDPKDAEGNTLKPKDRPFLGLAAGCLHGLDLLIVNEQGRAALKEKIDALFELWEAPEGTEKTMESLAAAIRESPFTHARVLIKTMVRIGRSEKPDLVPPEVFDKMDELIDFRATMEGVRKLVGADKDKATTPGTGEPKKSNFVDFLKRIGIMAIVIYGVLLVVAAIPLVIGIPGYIATALVILSYAVVPVTAEQLFQAVLLFGFFWGCILIGRLVMSPFDNVNGYLAKAWNTVNPANKEGMVGAFFDGIRKMMPGYQPEATVEGASPEPETPSWFLKTFNLVSIIAAGLAGGITLVAMFIAIMIGAYGLLIPFAFFLLVYMVAAWGELTRRRFHAPWTTHIPEVTGATPEEIAASRTHRQTAIAALTPDQRKTFEAEGQYKTGIRIFWIGAVAGFVLLVLAGTAMIIGQMAADTAEAAVVQEEKTRVETTEEVVKAPRATAGNGSSACETAKSDLRKLAAKWNTAEGNGLGDKVKLMCETSQSSKAQAACALAKAACK